MEFKDVLTDPAQFRELMGEPPPPCVAKTMAMADQHCRAFIARSPFVLIASSNARGQTDISPKGDAAGFVRVLDDKTLAIPDRPGNRRADTFTNVLANPQVGLLFFVPGKSETLRFSGSARIVRDIDLRESMAVLNKGAHLQELSPARGCFGCRRSPSGACRRGATPRLGTPSPRGLAVSDLRRGKRWSRGTSRTRRALGRHR